MTTVLFFGSFQHYSTIVLEALYQTKNIKVLGVVTAPPRPAGRHLRLTRTHTHDWAEKHGLPVFTPQRLDRPLPLVPDFFVVAGYRLLLPRQWLELPTMAALNFHPSLLPAYPGPAPVEWAMLKGEKETGITIIKMTEEYDQGPIIAQKKLPILPTDTRLTLYQKLYEFGASILIELLPSYRARPCRPTGPGPNEIVYARRLSRTDGYIPWPQARAFLTQAKFATAINRKIRALYGFPGVWTQVKTAKGTKILKILSSTQVQLEGKTPTTFSPALVSSLT